MSRANSADVRLSQFKAALLVLRHTVNTSELPSTYNPYSPDPASYRILTMTTHVVEYVFELPLPSQIPYRQEIQQFWPRLRDWVALFIRHSCLLDSEHLASPPMPMHHHIAVSMALCTMEIVRPQCALQVQNPLDGAEDFVQTLLELCVKFLQHEVDTRTASYFAQLWLALAQLVTSEMAVQSVKSSLLSIRERYPIPKLCVERASMQWAGLDLSPETSIRTRRATISVAYFLAFSLSFSSEPCQGPSREILALDGILWLSRMVTQIALQLHGAEEPEIGAAYQCFLVCSELLHWAFRDSYKWVEQALRGHLIMAVSVFGAQEVSLIWHTIKEEVLGLYGGIFDTLICYLFIRNIRNMFVSNASHL
ncbi:hypothetical protein VNI00_017118 [Paramarasmius palmivorus]|uniref:Uncharacterized protein n=1 Tax=Paramarasmius palmivorus TaxID=297713 RepID=A0AAW0B8N4_9AGAR